MNSPLGQEIVDAAFALAYSLTPDADKLMYQIKKLNALAERAAAADRLARAAVALDSPDWPETDADGIPLVAHEHEAAMYEYLAVVSEAE